jgi:hypothetical protein
MDKISEIDSYLKTLDLPTKIEKWIYLEKLVEQGIINALNNQIKAEQIRNYFQLTCYFNYRLTKDHPDLGSKLLATELVLGDSTHSLCYWLSSFALLQVPNLAIPDRDLSLLIQKCRYYVEEIRPKFHEVLTKL